ILCARDRLAIAVGQRAAPAAHALSACAGTLERASRPVRALILTLHLARARVSLVNEDKAAERNCAKQSKLDQRLHKSPPRFHRPGAWRRPRTQNQRCRLKVPSPVPIHMSRLRDPAFCSLGFTGRGSLLRPRTGSGDPSMKATKRPGDE